MQNKPNFSKSQMFIIAIKTTNYSEKMKVDTWSKQTQSNPILSRRNLGEGGFIRRRRDNWRYGLLI
jgi:hypothetical protein